jgi:hypothetical protein
MSKRHQASRRRAYGRRQHELYERRERGWNALQEDRDPVDDGFVPAEGPAADRRTASYGTTWLGLE